MGVLLVLLCVAPILALDNGLAKTPPMGWMSWERFRCNTDCKNDPEFCLSEHLIKEIADEMVIQGFAAAGYEYVIIDDCWLSHQRDANGSLQPDPDRFPSGIKALADYVHALGLKFGIYEDYGTMTCGGYPGILGHLEQDANTLASWEIDYLKVDGCYADPKTMDKGYPEFGYYLNKTGRPIVYSCSWPDYLPSGGLKPNYTLIAKHCNLWRNYGDIGDSWEDVLDIIDHYAEVQDEIAPHAGPGHWNDPDMLILGNFGLSYDQARVQMALWAIFAAPLIMSNDLRTIRPEFKELLLNKNVIKINQDPLGIQGRKVKNNTNNVDFFVKPVMPMYRGNTSAAVAIMNRHSEYGNPLRVTFQPSSIGLEHPDGYAITEVFGGEFLGAVGHQDQVVIMVNPTGVVLLRFDVQVKKEVHANSLDAAMEDFDYDNEPQKVQVEDPGKSGCLGECLK